MRWLNPVGVDDSYSNVVYFEFNIKLLQLLTSNISNAKALHFNYCTLSCTIDDLHFGF